MGTKPAGIPAQLSVTSFPILCFVLFIRLFSCCLCSILTPCLPAYLLIISSKSLYSSSHPRSWETHANNSPGIRLFFICQDRPGISQRGLTRGLPAKSFITWLSNRWQSRRKATSGYLKVTAKYSHLLLPTIC